MAGEFEPAVYNQSKHCPQRQPWSTPWPQGKWDSRRENPNCCQQGCFSRKTGEAGAGQRLAAPYRLCFCLSKISQSNAREKMSGFFFLSRRWRCEGPSKPYCNQLISAGKASGFAIDRMKLISSNDGKPVDLLEGCKNNSDMSIVAQENCVPSSNRRSPNMQSQH